MSVESNPGFLWICSTSVLKIGLGKVATCSKPIRCQTEATHDLVARAFGCVPDYTWSPHWLMTMQSFVMIGYFDCFGFYGFQLKTALLLDNSLNLSETIRMIHNYPIRTHLVLFHAWSVFDSSEESNFSL